jgi:hypothetical protein
MRKSYGNDFRNYLAVGLFILGLLVGLFGGIELQKKEEHLKNSPISVDYFNYVKQRDLNINSLVIIFRTNVDINFNEGDWIAFSCTSQNETRRCVLMRSEEYDN